MSYLDELFSLKDKTAIVTGAARGNGKAIAQAFLKAGASVVLVDILKKELKQTKKEFGCESFLCDITDKDKLKDLVSFTINKFKKIDVLVNNAGITLPYDILDYPEENWDKTYEVNLKAPFILSQIVAKQMIKKNFGSIINITSINAEIAFPDNPAYVAFKGALKQLTKAFALDLGKYGIRVNNVGPGYMKTDMTKKSYADPVLNKQRKDKTTLGRWGYPEDLAGAVIFLASDASSYITGQDIYVDGGWLIKGL